MNIYSYIKEASITDYIDSDALYQALKDCPVTSNLELVECYDDMTIKMKGDMGFQFFKVVKGPEGLEAYKIAEKSGEKLGDAFPLTSDLEETEKEESYEEIEDKINEIKEKLAYCDRRDEVCLAIDGEQERAELEAELERLESKLKSFDECSLKEGTALRGSVYTNIVRQIDDACSEESDEEEIRKFLQDLIGYIKDTAESYNVIVETATVEEVDKVNEVVENFKSSKVTPETFTEALNTISKLEYDNEISRADYDRGLELLKEVYKEKHLHEADLVSYLFEAPNPENADANRLIKLALKDALFAYNHRDELNKIGIDVEYKTWSTVTDGPAKVDDFVSCYLVGKNGRKLACNTSYWEVGSMPASRDLNRTSGNYYDYADEDTFAKKSYKDSKEQVKNAKAELPTLKKRLKLYERRYGKDSRQYRELVKYIEQTKEIIDQGIKAHKQTDYRQKPDENVDYKNYLDSKKIKDREKPYEAPRMNPTLAAFKGAKSDEEYEAREEERNRKQDEEDAQRIADMAKRAAEEKSRRDAYLAKSRERTQATLKEIRDRIAASKAKRGTE